MGMDTSVRVARSMTWGRKGRGPRGAIGDTDSRSTSGPDPAAGDIRIVTVLAADCLANLSDGVRGHSALGIGAEQTDR